MDAAASAARGRRRCHAGADRRWIPAWRCLDLARAAADEEGPGQGGSRKAACRNELSPGHQRRERSALGGGTMDGPGRDAPVAPCPVRQRDPALPGVPPGRQLEPSRALRNGQAL